jgi:acid phosphatase
MLSLPIDRIQEEPLMSRYLTHLFLAVILSNCVGATAQTVAPLAPSERIPNLDKLKDRIRAYHDCKDSTYCYTHDLDLQANRAIAFLHRRAAHIPAGEKLTLIFDIDETTLSNYEEMVGADFGYDNTRFNDWVNSAKAPVIPGTLRIFKEAQQLGVSVIFLTGRPESQRAVTEQNLHAQGFDKWQELILRPPDQANATALAYKSAARARVVAEGYKIILNVGDQWSDLRGKPMAEYSVKYPDPYYFIK